MAKSFSNGQLILDGAGQGYGIDTASGPTSSSQIGLVKSYIKTKSIDVDPSAASWVIVLSHQDGSVAWSMKGADARGGNFVGPFEFMGIVLTTATNITRVILNNSEWIRN